MNYAKNFDFYVSYIGTYVPLETFVDGEIVDAWALCNARGDFLPGFPTISPFAKILTVRKDGKDSIMMEIPRLGEGWSEYPSREEALSDAQSLWEGWVRENGFHPRSLHWQGDNLLLDSEIEMISLKKLSQLEREDAQLEFLAKFFGEVDTE